MLSGCTFFITKVVSGTKVLPLLVVIAFTINLSSCEMYGTSLDFIKAFGWKPSTEILLPVMSKYSWSIIIFIFSLLPESISNQVSIWTDYPITYGKAIMLTPIVHIKVFIKLFLANLFLLT